MKNYEELAIHDLVARYCDSLVRADVDAWAATWASDGHWEIGEELTARGREAAVSLLRRLTEPFACIVQIASNPMIRVHDDGVSAHGRWTILELLSATDGSGLQNVGVYDDEYRLEDGRWCFAHRRFQFLFSGPASLSAPASGFPVIADLV